MDTQVQRDFEIEFLEKLYALPSGENKMPIENETMTELMADAIKEMEVAAKRQGTIGPWCFGCGRTNVPAAACECPYPESFGCQGKVFCAECRTARTKIGTYLQAMFAAKISHRVTSIRSRKYNRIADAADTEGLPRGQKLREYLFRFADPDEDEPDKFVANVFRALKRSGFFDFRGLANALEQIERDFVIFKIVRSGLVGRLDDPYRKFPEGPDTMKVEDREFYE